MKPKQLSECLTKEVIDRGFVTKTSSLEETKALGKAIAAFLNKRAVLLFKGDLGAGKTTLIKALAEALDISPNEVTSPTFSLLHIYHGKRPLYHFDLYRLENETEFVSLGFADLLENDALFCIEWPEKIPSFIFEGDIYVIEMHHLSLNERTIKFTKKGAS